MTSLFEGGEMTKWQEKGVGVLSRKGTSQRKPVVDERDGTVGGFHTEHWDGSQDAHVMLKPLPAKARPQEGMN